MPKQFHSRLKRFEEKRLRTRLFLALIGSLVLVVLIVFFGFKLLISFFVFLDQTRGTEPQKQERALVLAPYLDPLPNATSSGKIVVSGRGQPNSTIVIFVNNTEEEKEKIESDGTFSVKTITLSEGENTIQAKTEDEKGNQSEFSNSIKTLIKRGVPQLEVTKPEENAIFSGENNLLTIEGRTEEENDVRINDRFVIVKYDGSFSYPFPLSDGENTLHIRAIDRAGNSKEITRVVTYTK